MLFYYSLQNQESELAQNMIKSHILKVLPSSDLIDEKNDLPLFKAYSQV
ncbi:putative uncharacterized protein [Parachlamydia acanthamoebae UV-7]|uniref:Uncharacterized protein n=1 Tax=Parachlamydia acanthamoebae (strain UV7) TaxID=765952 RepID=F8KXB2_PARAV|nr:putative uncharacterized protein [Parachlamydia acanthamoebae UV-7]